MKHPLVRAVILSLLAVLGALVRIAEAAPQGAGVPGEQSAATPPTEQVVVGGGCFWCMEAIFKGFNGVVSVESGYAGGSKENPTYDDLGPADSQHAEVVQITFEPKVITLEQILTVFFHSHDPTTPNRQGVDVGSQYRSIILYGSAAQKETAERILAAIQAEGLWGKSRLVTELAPLVKFYRAEEYHQDYFAKNPRNQYCAVVIGPKIQKIRHEFKALLKVPK